MSFSGGHYEACMLSLILLCSSASAVGMAVSAPAAAPARIGVPTHCVSVGAKTLSLAEGLDEVGNAFETDTTGFKIWDAGRALSRLLSDEASSLRGKRVLELGSGTGVGGLTAAAAGASVCLTDGSEDMLGLLECNARTNSLADRVMVRQLRWGYLDECREIAAAGPFDLIVGSDLLYAPELFPDLLETLTTLATPGRTEVVLTYPPRWTESIFLEAAEEEFEQIDCPVEVEPSLWAARLIRREE